MMRVPNNFTPVGGLVAVSVDRFGYLKSGSLILPSADNGTALNDAMDGNISDKELSSQGKFRIPVHGVVSKPSNDLEVGDVVFFSKSESENCEKGKLDDGSEVFFILYSKLFAYKRGEELVMLNNYILGNTRTETVMNIEVKHPTQVVVTHIGTPSVNKRTGELSAKDVMVGDMVYYAIPSERFIEQSHTHILGFDTPPRIINRDYILGIKR
jgi:hypothetical protein